MELCQSYPLLFFKNLCVQTKFPWSLALCWTSVHLGLGCSLCKVRFNTTRDEVVARWVEALSSLLLHRKLLGVLLGCWFPFSRPALNLEILQFSQVPMDADAVILWITLGVEANTAQRGWLYNGTELKRDSTMNLWDHASELTYRPQCSCLEDQGRTQLTEMCQLMHLEC